MLIFNMISININVLLVCQLLYLWIICFSLGNYYGTPKPPAEPSPVQPDLVDQVLFDEEFDTEVQRKRTTSVSKMDRKDSAAPEEEEEEERPPIVNGLTGETVKPAIKYINSISFEHNVCSFSIAMYCAV